MNLLLTAGNNSVSHRKHQLRKYRAGSIVRKPVLILYTRRDFSSMIPEKVYEKHRKNNPVHAASAVLCPEKMRFFRKLIRYTIVDRLQVNG